MMMNLVRVIIKIDNLLKLKYYFIYMGSTDTLELIINKNIINNFAHSIKNNKTITKIHTNNFGILNEFSLELIKIEKNIFCNNTYGLINSFNSIYKLVNKQLIIMTEIEKLFSNLYIQNYIELKNIFIHNIAPLYTNIHNKFIILLNRFNMEINIRIVDLLKSNGYDKDICNNKYNNDIKKLTRTLELINIKKTKILTNIRL